MKIQIQSIHFDADQKLLEYIQAKLSKLDKYFDHITDAQVFLKVSKPEVRQNKIVEVKLNVPGEQLLATETGDRFEEATDLALENLKRQVVRFKEKIREH